MSRIRSVHPGLFTDEAFVCLTDAAQIFFIGLWTECDDQGAFEWKPVQLRLKLRGNRDGGVDGLLDELEASKCICSYEHEGRKYGLVRNFQRFQRPKKPNSVHFIPPEFRTFVGLKADSSEPPPHSSEDTSPPVPHQFPTSGEKSPQMEDGGGRMEEVVSRIASTRAIPDPLEAQLREAAGWQSDPSPNLLVTGPIHALIDNGADLHLDVLPVVKAVAPRCKGRKNWNYFTAAIAEARDRRIEAATIVSPPSDNRRPTHAATQQKPSRDETFAAIDRRIDELERQQADSRAIAAGD